MSGRGSRTGRKLFPVRSLGLKRILGPTEGRIYSERGREVGPDQLKKYRKLLSSYLFAGLDRRVYNSGREEKDGPPETKNVLCFLSQRVSSPRIEDKTR